LGGGLGAGRGGRPLPLIANCDHRKINAGAQRRGEPNLRGE